MVDDITLSAKTLDDAITEALVQLGVTSDRLDYIVVEKGSEGFLGIGRKQAVIKARRKQEEKPVEEVVRAERGRTGKRIFTRQKTGERREAGSKICSKERSRTCKGGTTDDRDM